MKNSLYYVNGSFELENGLFVAFNKDLYFAENLNSLELIFDAFTFVKNSFNSEILNVFEFNVSSSCENPIENPIDDLPF